MLFFKVELWELQADSLTVSRKLAKRRTLTCKLVKENSVNRHEAVLIEREAWHSPARSFWLLLHPTKEHD